MADITYTPSFKHNDYVDNETIVQASGPDGFNQRFHDIEAEHTKISAVVGEVNAAIKKIQQLELKLAQSTITLAAGAVSTEFDVETYDRAALPTNVEKVYFPIILPASGPKHIQTTFLYQTVPGNKIKVTVVFFNPGGTPATFGFRVITLTAQS